MLPGQHGPASGWATPLHQPSLPRRRVRVLHDHPHRPLTAETHACAVGISRDRGYSFHDSLILASAIEIGCDTVLTEDMQDGHVIGPVTIRNPFS